MHGSTLPTLDDIRLMIEQRPRSVELVQIANAANSSLPWLKQVISGKTRDPSYVRIKAIYEFLKSKAL